MVDPTPAPDTEGKQCPTCGWFGQIPHGPGQWECPDKASHAAVVARMNRNIAANDEPLESFEDWYAKTKDYGGTHEEYDKLREALPNADATPSAEGAAAQPANLADGGGAETTGSNQRNTGEVEYAYSANCHI